MYILLRMESITKTFPGVKALDGVNFELRKGEIHGLLGENGAGKTTLVKVLAGILRKDDGKIILNNKEVDISDPLAARKLGISMIHQELSLIPNLTVAENIFIGREITRGPFQLVDFSTQQSNAQQILEMVGGGIDPRVRVNRLSLGEQQRVEIARALSLDVMILIMDEATSALTSREIGRLFETIRTLKSKEISIVYITHRIDEIFEICDRVTVLRDGKVVGTVNPTETEKEEIIRMIIGRELRVAYPGKKVGTGALSLRVENISSKSTGRVKLSNVSFEVRKGEILGITGLMGAGKTEIARAIWGMDTLLSGKIYVDGKEAKIKHPFDAKKLGLAYMPEERRSQGIVPEMNIVENISLPNLEKFSKLIFVNQKKEVSAALQWIKKLKIVAAGYRQKLKNLSGGNQQKVVISKWLETEPKILIVDEPTRGIDVGIKVEIRRLLRELADQGIAIILLSSEIDEILELSDRILVLYGGKVVGSLHQEEATKEKILAFAMGAGEYQGAEKK